MRALRWLLPLLLFVAGCNDAPPIYGENPPKLYRSAVSISPGTTELAAAVYPGLTLRGRSESCDMPPTVQRLPVVTKGIKPDKERILKVRPDVILYDADLFTENDLKPLTDLGFEAWGLKANSLEEYEQSLYELAKLTGSETSASNFMDKVYRALANARGNAPQNKPKVAVLMPGANGAHMIGGTKSFVADIIEQSGGEVVGADSHLFVPMNAESFIKDNPAVIIVPAYPDQTTDPAQVIFGDQRFASVDAVKNKRIFNIPADLLLRKGARVDKLIDGISRAVVVGGGAPSN